MPPALTPSDQLKRLRERAGLSMAKMALAAGYKGASSYQRFEDKRITHGQGLPLKFVRRIAPSLVGAGNPPIELEELLQLVEPTLGDKSIDETVRSLIETRIEEREEAEARLFREDPKLAQQWGPRAKLLLEANRDADADVPIFQTLALGEGPAYLKRQTAEWIARPQPLKGVIGAFGIYISNSDAAPVFEIGDIVFVHPTRPPRRGDDCCFLSDEEPTQVVIARYLGRIEDAWELDAAITRRTQLDRTEWPTVMPIVAKFSR